MWTRLVAICTCLCMPALLNAATLREADVGGRGFSSANPYQTITPFTVADGVNRVEGTITAQGFDFLRFLALAPGAHRFDILFTFASQPPERVLSAGFANFRAVAPQGLFGGQRTPTLMITPTAPTAQVRFTLDDSFAGGDLFVGIMPRAAPEPIQYVLSAASNTPSPVPLPRSVWFLLGAVLMLRLIRLHSLHGWSRRAICHPDTVRDDRCEPENRDTRGVRLYRGRIGADHCNPSQL